VNTNKKGPDFAGAVHEPFFETASPYRGRDYFLPLFFPPADFLVAFLAAFLAAFFIV
jgi:hypothetical protein